MLYKAQALGSHEALGIHHMLGTYICDCTHLQSTAIHCLWKDAVFPIPTKPSKRGILWTSQRGCGDVGDTATMDPSDLKYTLAENTR
jgi:hypothetical protein